MGAYVSTANCAAHYGVEANCSVVLSEDRSTALLLGESTFGLFPGDPDIAGAGVLGAFFAVTAASLLLAIVSSAWWAAKNIFGTVRRLSRQEKSVRNWQLSVTGIIEALIITCSDQQVFTGGAYAITLRYAKACSVSAYHYNIVANILLVTCATHLMAVTIARQYWQHPYLGVLRITVTTLVYVITGVLLSNQGSGSLGFPTEVPSYQEQYSLMLLPAACFQAGKLLLDEEVKKAFSAGSVDAFFRGQIHGWTNFILMFMFYIIAVFVSVGRVIRRGLDHDGKRKRFVEKLQSKLPFLFKVRRLFYALFGLYLAAGIAISSWTVVVSAMYVYRLRRWVDRSGWLELAHGRNPENDPSTFGQLVPLLLISLTVFTFLQIVNERIHARRRRSKRLKYASLRRNNPDSQPPSASSDTQGYSAVSVSLGAQDQMPGDGVHQQHEVYDSPYTDKGKSQPTVAVAPLKEPLPIALTEEVSPQPQPQVPITHAPASAQYLGHGLRTNTASDPDLLAIENLPPVSTYPENTNSYPSGSEGAKQPTNSTATTLAAATAGPMPGHPVPVWVPFPTAPSPAPSTSPYVAPPPRRGLGIFALASLAREAKKRSKRDKKRGWSENDAPGHEGSVGDGHASQSHGPNQNQTQTQAQTRSHTDSIVPVDLSGDIGLGYGPGSGYGPGMFAASADFVPAPVVPGSGPVPGAGAGSGFVPVSNPGPGPAPDPHFGAVYTASPEMRQSPSAASLPFLASGARVGHSLSFDNNTGTGQGGSGGWFGHGAERRCQMHPLAGGQGAGQEWRGEGDAGLGVGIGTAVGGSGEGNGSGLR